MALNITAGYEWIVSEVFVNRADKSARVKLQHGRKRKDDQGKVIIEPDGSEAWERSGIPDKDFSFSMMEFHVWTAQHPVTLPHATVAGAIDADDTIYAIVVPFVEAKINSGEWPL